MKSKINEGPLTVEVHGSLQLRMVHSVSFGCHPLSVPKRNFSKFSGYNLQCCQRKTLVRRFQSKASPIPKQFPNKSSSESFVFVKYAGFSLGVSFKKLLFFCGLTFEVLAKV